MSIELVMPSNHLVPCHPLFFLPSVFHSFRVFANKSALHIRWPKYRSFSLNISPSNKYSRGLTGLISCSPTDSQKSSPTPQLKSINSLVLSLVYDAKLTSTHDYWKNYSFDYTDLCWQSNVSDFGWLHCLGWS